MEVHRHRVGALDAVEEVPAPAGDEQPTAVRRVDVQPRPVLVREVGGRAQWVDRPVVGGAGGGDDGHRHGALGFHLGQRVGQRVGTHPAPPVDGDGHDGVGGEAQQSGRPLDGVVPVDRDQHPQPVEVGPGARADVVAGQVQALQVGLGAAGGEDPVGGGAEARPLADPVDQVALHERAAD